MPESSYSIVIVTAGRRDSLRRCVDATLAQTVPPEEVLVIAAAPADRPAWLPDGIKFHIRPPSTTGQRNAGANLAVGEYVLFVDDDNLLEPNFAAEVLLAVERPRDRVVAAAGVIHNGPQLSRGSSLLYALLGLGHTSFGGRASRLRWSGHLVSVYAPIAEVSAGFVHLCCTVVDRQVMLAERLDENFSGYVLGEDLDFSARLRSYGILLQVPTARSTVLDVPTTAPNYDYELGMLHGEVLSLFRWRHRGPGFLGTFCWWWSHVGQMLVLIGRALRTGSWSSLRGYCSGLRSALKRRQTQTFQRWRRAGSDG